MSVGIWQTLSGLQDLELKRLTSSLSDTVLHSRAGSTATKYLYAFQRWREWAGPRREVAVFPVQEVHFALYLQHLGEAVQSKAAVEEAVNAIGWVHQLAGHPPIVASPFVRAMLAGLQWKLAKPKVPKEPITTDILVALVDSLGPTPTLADIRLAASCLLAFVAFLRYDELAKIRCCDVRSTAQSMSVHITSSKTDQYREGASVLVAKTGSPICPVAMLERYFSLAGLSHSSKLRLFRGIVHTKKGGRLRASGSLSDTRMRELLLAKLSSLGFNAKSFGVYSLRSGGATAAANAGVPDRLFKRHSHWRSESAKDGYVKDSVSSLLSVSRRLGL